VNAPTRVAVFGGTFDPPHVGHRIVATDVVTALSLDRLIVVPAAHPPHRETTLPGDVRLALTRRAFAPNPRIEVSDIEFRREGPSYTVETLEQIRAARPDDRLFLVIGSDQFEGFGEWREPERIAELAELAVMRRGGGRATADGRFPFRPVDVTRVDLSSTEIRRRLGAGRSIRYLVPDAIHSEVLRAWDELDTAGETMRYETGYETRC